MLMRVFQFTVHDGKEAEFRDFFEHTALPLMQRQDGLVSITAGTPRPETPQEFCMVMLWRDLDALKAFAGDGWRDAHVHADEALLVKARRVSHYEVVAH
jgi:heme-degrading monooxygenase HmoA